MSPLWRPVTESSALEGRSFPQGCPHVQSPPCCFCGCRGATRGDGLGRRVRPGPWGQWCAGVFSISFALPQSSAKGQWKLCGAHCFHRWGSTGRPGGLRNHLRQRAVWRRRFVHRGLWGLPGRHMRITPSWRRGETQLPILQRADMVTRAVDKLGLDWEADAVQTQSQSKLDDRFLTSRAPTQSCKLLPFLVRWRRWWRLSATCGSTSWHKRKGQIFSHGWPDIQGWTVRKFSHRSGGEIQGSEAAISRFLPADSAQTQGNKAVSDDGGTLALVSLTTAEVPREKSHHLWHPLVRIGVLGLIHWPASASGKD